VGGAALLGAQPHVGGRLVGGEARRAERRLSTRQALISSIRLTAKAARSRECARSTLPRDREHQRDRRRRWRRGELAQPHGHRRGVAGQHLGGPDRAAGDPGAQALAHRDVEHLPQVVGAAIGQPRAAVDELGLVDEQQVHSFSTRWPAWVQPMIPAVSTRTSL
jgi:hypothetical protein